MDNVQTNQVLKVISDLLSRPGRTLSEIYSVDMNISFFGENKELEQRQSNLQERLACQLSSLGRQFPIFLEMLGLFETRIWFVEEWKTFSDNLGKTEWWHTEEDDDIESKPLGFLYEIYRAISAQVEKIEVEDSGIETNIERLEYILRRTPEILESRNITPRCEADIRKAMNEHLKYTFEDYSTNISIAKPLKSFKPDCGIISIGAAIEFKFCDSEKEVKTALSGIMEDLSGYAGSKDWKLFYSLVYMTGSYANEKQFRVSLGSSENASKWKPILVKGSGSRKPAPQKQ